MEGKVQPGSVVLLGLKVLERLVKIDRQDLLEVKAVLENVVKKGTTEMLVLVDLQDLLEAKAMLELVVKKAKREMSVALVHKGLYVQKAVQV